MTDLELGVDVRPGQLVAVRVGWRLGGREAQTAARLGGDVEAGATQSSTRYERRQLDDSHVQPRTLSLVPHLYVPQPSQSTVLTPGESV